MTQPIRFIDLGVGGMTCDDCVHTVAEALGSVPGVARASVDLESHSAVVEAHPGVVPDDLTVAVRATRHYNAFVRGIRTDTDD